MLRHLGVSAARAPRPFIRTMRQVRMLGDTDRVASTTADGDAKIERIYHKRADVAMEALNDQLSSLEEGAANALEGFDCEYASGVLTLKLGLAHGTYVINKQPPTCQIWLSSPKSGPRRFEFDPAKARWLSTRDGVSLGQLLSAELSAVFGQAIEVHGV